MGSLFSVAQIFNLLYRRIAFCRACECPEVSRTCDPCRLQIGDTAESNSALRLRAGDALNRYPMGEGCDEGERRIQLHASG